MDIKTLEREINAGKDNYRKLKDKESALVRDISTKKAQATKYKTDSERATATAKKITDEYTKVAAELVKIEGSLKDNQTEIAKYTKSVQDLEMKFKDMTRELERQQRSQGNSSSAPTQRRSGGIFG